MAGVEFTDGILRALRVPTPVPGTIDRFMEFLPDSAPIGPARPSLATGILHRSRFRDDQTATFRMHGFTGAQLDVALRLKRHLMNGGSAVVRTEDNADRTYTVYLAPETTPRIEGPDRRGRYSFVASVLNADPAVPLLCSYRGPALIMHAGDALASFTRASTATYRDDRGILRAAASGVPRFHHYENGVRTLLVEGGRTNRALRSEEMGNGAVWVPTGLASVTDNDPILLAPDGAQTADRLVEDTGTSEHRIAQSVTIGAGETCAYSVWFRAGNRFRCRVFVGAGGSSAAMQLTFRTDTLAVTTSVSSGATIARTYVETWANGWYRLVLVGLLDGVSTSANLVLNLLDDAGTTSYLGTGAGAYFWGAQVERFTPFASSYIKTEGAEVTRSADVASVSLALGPRGMWVYHRFRERGTIESSGARGWHLGTTSAPHLYVHREASNGRYEVVHHNGGVPTDPGLSGAVPSVNGDETEILVQVDENGRPDIYQSINRGAVEAVVGSGTSIGFASAWGSSLLWIGSDNGNSVGFAAHERLVVGRGSLGSGSGAALMALARGIAA